MCKIYEFPTAMVLPKELKKRLEVSAKDYVKTLSDILHYFDHEDFDEEDLAKVMELILITYLQSIDEATEELGL